MYEFYYYLFCLIIQVAKFQDVELPNACTGLQRATITNVRSLTTEFTSVKHALELELDIEVILFQMSVTIVFMQQTE